jgi:glutathione peroxidase
MNIYDFSVKDQRGNRVPLSLYRGKVILIVNTATRCGFTPTYKGLEATYQHYKDQGFSILDFPCNQFGGQAPEDDEEINNFCLIHYQTHFPRYAKLDVNGEKADPLFVYLEEQKGFSGFDPDHPLTKVLTELNEKNGTDWDKNPSIKWNFTKFLISKNGEVLARYEPTTKMEDIEKDIQSALADGIPPLRKTTLLKLTLCPHCISAERALKKYGIAYDEVSWSKKEGKALAKTYNVSSVPVLFAIKGDGIETIVGSKEIALWAKDHAQ